jgi:hypothetical protein
MPLADDRESLGSKAGLRTDEKGMMVRSIPEHKLEVLKHKPAR